MRPGDRTGVALSALFIGVVLLCGVVAIRGGLILGEPPSRVVEAPDWVAQAAGNGTFPAFRMGPDGASVQVGRAVLRPDGDLDLLLFPDKGKRALDGAVALVLPTDPRALWATVPADSKSRIAERMQTLVAELRTQALAMLAEPVFSDTYRPALTRLLNEAVDDLRTDPRLAVLESALEDLMARSDVAALGPVLMRIVLPEARAVLLETFTPRWDAMDSLFGTAPAGAHPLRDAVGRVLANPDLHAALMDVGGRIAADQTAWRMGALAVDVLIDALAGHPEFEPLMTRMANDPGFAPQMQRIEQALTRFSTALFDLIMGRGARSQTDPLAIQMLRYVLVNRRSAVVVLVHAEDLYKIAVERYRAPLHQAPLPQHRSAS